MKIVFFGSSKYVVPVIEMLRKNFDLGLIVTTEKKLTDAVPFYATRNKIPFLSVENLRSEDVLEKIQSEKAEVGVLGYFRCIIPQSVLSVFPKGIINIHPSLLPKYRGSTPVQNTLLNGDATSGTTIILLDKQVDHGAVLIQKEEKILPSDTTDSLHERLFTLGSRLIEEVLSKYLRGEIQLMEQNHSEATFTQYLSKSDGLIDLDNPPAKDRLDRMIRAYYPWPGVWVKVKIRNEEKILKLLPEHTFQLEGKKPMALKDFLNGYPELTETLQYFF